VFIAIQFPIADCRAFVNSDTNRLSLPTWPLPKPDKEFIRGSGIVRQRRRGGLESWPGEEIYCRANRAIRFSPFLSMQRIRPLEKDISFICAFRRFLCDGETLSRVEIGFLIRGHRFPTQFFPVDNQDILGLINGCLSIQVRVLLADGINTTCELYKCGEQLAKHYLQATTQRVNSELAETEDWWLSPGNPLMLIEYKSHEISRLPKQAKPIMINTSDTGFFGSLNHYGIKKGGKRLGVWFLDISDDNPEVIRRIRLHLFRIHAEKECLKQTLRLLILGSLQPRTHTAASDNLQRYLKDSMRLLSREARYHLSQSALLEEMLKVEDIVTPGERATLLAQLSKIDIRTTIYHNVEKFTANTTGSTQYYNIVGNDISVFIGRDQRIGGTQMTKYEIKFGDNNKFSGDFVVANSIQHSFNKISSSDASQEIKEKLKELSQAVAEMCEHLPHEKAREAARDLDTLTNEALSDKPRRKWYEMSADGLVKAAETVGKVAVPVITIVMSLLPMLGIG